jgi:hypothetical protein
MAKSCIASATKVPKIKDSQIKEEKGNVYFFDVRVLEA